MNKNIILPLLISVLGLSAHANDEDIIEKLRYRLLVADQLIELVRIERLLFKR